MSRVMRLVVVGLVVCALCVCSCGFEKIVQWPVGKEAKRFRAIPAFPGAEGFGAFTPGGRGGKVYVVTTLEDYDFDQRPIPGSFRAAVEAEGPRIIVFAVSGTLWLKRAIYITHPYVTIAGQTAPGDGICLAGRAIWVSEDCHDVILRYLRSRLGDICPGDNDAMDGINCSNVILDHCSASWSIDECLSVYNNQNITVQWCLVAEGLYQSYHAKGRHGYGGIWGGHQASYHHNLLAHNSSRNPRFNEGSYEHNLLVHGVARSPGSPGEVIDYRNNVIYNWGFNSAYGGEGTRVNIIANYYKAGPATEEKVRNRIVNPDVTGRWYVADNYVAGFPDVTADNWNGGIQLKEKDQPRLAEIRVREPFPAAAVATQTAEQAYEAVLAHVGANRPRRDSVDTRIIEEVRTGTAKFGRTWGDGGKGIIDSQEDVGGWPKLQGGPAPADRDADGMPDAWEQARKLNPDDASDAAADADGDGYTNIEEYLNNTDPQQFVDYTDPANNKDNLQAADDHR